MRMFEVSPLQVLLHLARILFQSARREESSEVINSVIIFPFFFLKILFGIIERARAELKILESKINECINVILIPNCTVEV